MSGPPPVQDLPNKRPHPDDTPSKNLPRAPESYEEEIAALHEVLGRANSARKRHRQTRREQDAVLNKQQAELLEATKEIALWKQRCHTMKHQTLPTKDRQIQHLEERLRVLGVQVEEKESELRPLKALFSTHNEISDADVLKAVDHINNLVEQLARENSERWLGLPPNPSQAIISPEHVPPLVDEALGDDFVELLADIPASATYASLLLQFAWQAIIAQISLHMLGMVCFMYPDDADKRRMTEDLAKAMEMSESQPLYGHWRAMTHRTLRGLQSEADQASDLDLAVTYAMTCCYRALQLILKTAYPQPPAFEDIFQKPLKEVFEEVLKLARTTKEDAISKNYSAFAFVSDSKFCPRQMVLEEEEDSATLEDRVACTTRLGLSYTSKQGRGNAEVTEWVILQKAQVVTKAVLSELQETADTDGVDQSRAEGDS